MSVPPPQSIPIPPPPPLDPDVSLPSSHTDERTNTLALVLPHQQLFAPPVLALLREHYEAFGRIAHWAPVRGFGRVIVVYENDEDAGRAKREGDWLRLHVPSSPLEEVGGVVEPESREVGMDIDHESREDQERESGEEAGQPGTEYFAEQPGHRRRKSRTKPSNDLILRLYNLPPTPLNPDPASFHLAPPALPHNFLISPPGSPPEGWEPVVEDAPNTSILAEDLQRALEALQLNGLGGRGRRGSKEVILDEGGVRVEVEDTTRSALAEGEHEDGEEGMDLGEARIGDVEERLEGGHAAWTIPTQNSGAGLPGLGGISIGSIGGIGGGSPLGTPGFKMKPAPTARPPI